MEATKSVKIDAGTHLKLKRAAVGGKPIGQLIKDLVDRFLKAVAA